MSPFLSFGFSHKSTSDIFTTPLTQKLWLPHQLGNSPWPQKNVFSASFNSNFFCFRQKKKHLHPIHLVLAHAFVSLHQGYMRVWFCLDQRKISINLKKQVVQNKCQVVMLQEDIVFLQRYSLKISCLDLVFNFFYRNIYSFL